MANIDKNIVITPNVDSTTAQPNIVFTGQNAVPITLRMTDDGVLSWEGSAGQLFSITNNLTGVLFSINDISGLPILEITDTPSIVTYAPITGAGGATLLTDISSQCDGERSVFDLKQGQTLLSTSYIVDSKDLEVVVDGEQLTPYTDVQSWPWILDYDTNGSRGFRVRENRLIIYNAPDIGSRVSITMKKTAATRQKTRYPFSPSTVALGD
jgi:hypothetical protein